MNVTINGETRSVSAGQSLADLIAAHTTARSGVAVAVNGEVVPKTTWPDHVLEDGATIEILTAVQGG
ncbi:MAG TPA: sulfur carrier protein ThiS [Actinospica sp.]|jgi:sulfur carrier protein|nr:sulfur carrier protein ThiS [Actinospica sp.]